MKVLDAIALILIFIGSLNWGLIGFFNYNLIGSLFGFTSMFSRIIYGLVGLAGIYAISFLGREEYRN